MTKLYVAEVTVTAIFAAPDSADHELHQLAAEALGDELRDMTIDGPDHLGVLNANNALPPGWSPNGRPYDPAGILDGAPTIADLQPQRKA